jgi:flavin reductase (DIM6/NTAB) family NADH-FMN oxidoreductase RutF
MPQLLIWVAGACAYRECEMVDQVEIGGVVVTIGSHVQRDATYR